MGLATGIAKVLLPLCMVAGILGCFKLSTDNGLFELLGEQSKQLHPILIDSDTPLKVDWTGVGKVDEFLSSIILFFAPILDPKNLALGVQGVHFYGFLLSVWLVVLVESYRVGNVWKPIAFAAVWGWLMENVLMAFIGPLWCLTQLLTSPTAKTGPLTAERRTRLLVHPVELAILPWAVLVGAGIPTAALLVTAEEPTTPIYYSKQFWMLIRQMHPFTAAFAHPILSRIFGASIGVTPKTANQRDIAVSRSLRQVYRVATYLSMVPHLLMMTLIALPYLMPSALSPEAVEAFRFLSFYPAFPFWSKSPVRVNTVAEGAAYFLVWDETISSVSFLIWAWALNRNELPLDVSSGATSRGSGFIPRLLKTLAMVVIGGPGAAVVSLIEERDELALAASISTSAGTRIPSIEEAGKHNSKEAR